MRGSEQEVQEEEEEEESISVPQSDSIYFKSTSFPPSHSSPTRPSPKGHSAFPVVVGVPGMRYPSGLREREGPELE